MLRRIERLLVDLSVVSVLGLGALITLTVILRAVFNSGVPDAIVMVRELMVAAVILPLAATTASRAHIVVEFVSNRMPRRIREVTHTIASGGYFFGDLQLPKWPGRVIFLAGISFCWLRLALMVWGDIAAIRQGKPLPESGPGHEEV